MHLHYSEVMAHRNFRTELKIIFQNVLWWTWERRNELSNYYQKENPEIILLNATSLIDGNKVKIFNYNIYEKNYQNERHAGIAIAIRKDIDHQILDDFQDDIMAVKIETTKGQLIIATYYSPPRRNYMPIGEIKRLFQRNVPVYLMGDLNAHHQALGHNYADQKGNIIKNLMDRDIVAFKGPDFPTIVGKKGKPDIVLGNRYAFLNLAISPGQLTTSDHIPIIIILSTKAIIKDKEPRKNFKKANWEKYKEIIERETNSDEAGININQTDNNNINRAKIDSTIDKWMKNIINASDEAIPKTQITFHPNPRESDYLKLLENTYKNLVRNGLTTREKQQMIKNIQNEIKEENMRLSNEYWNNKIGKLNEIYNDPAKFWRGVRNLMGGKSTNVMYIKDNNGTKQFKAKEKESCFRHIWKNVFQISNEENQLFDLEHERRIITYMNNHEFEALTFNLADLDRLDPTNYMTKPITIREVKETIKSFKNNKAPGQSAITKMMMIQLPDNAIKRYTDIINLAFSMGYFPILFKNGILVLIPKPRKDPTEPINYRPITLLEIPGKVFEKIINKRLHKFCEQNNVFNTNQYGFRAGRGTDLAITRIYETISINQKHKHHCNIVCRDVKKAFDKVWHLGIKYKIITIRDLPSIVKKVLCNYLDKRTVQIKVEGVTGEKMQLLSGVPQGGILSPTLYIMYTKDVTPRPLLVEEGCPQSVG